MKSLFTFFTVVILSTFANAAEINSGKYNSTTKKVELNVSYGGGCSKHFFALELNGGCAESYPVQCYVNLVHTTDTPDICEAYITEDLQLDLPAEMLSDSYFTNAFITVTGAGQTYINFQLPK